MATAPVLECTVMVDVGSVLLGRYKLNARVGAGGMATVYDGEDLLLGRRVAIKIPHPALATDPAFLYRFVNEARAAAALAHPNVVAVYDVGEIEGLPFLVMEFVAGETLKDLLCREGPLPPESVVQVGIQVAAALDAAHRRGLIHRDIKPQNILLAPEAELGPHSRFRVKLADFGIALALGADSATRPGVLLGSAPYLAPELVRGESATPQSDIYALGVVLYEMSTGRLPYSGDTPLAMALQHVEAEPRRPTAWNPALPPALEGIILRAMAKAPAARFATAAELGAALQAVTQGAPAAAEWPTAAGTPAAAPTQRLLTGDYAPTTPWTWGQPGGMWGATTPLPVAERSRTVSPGSPPPPAVASWEAARPPIYPSARWPLLLLGLISLLCVLGLVPLGILVYRQMRLPSPPRVVPSSELGAPPRALAGAEALGGVVTALREQRPPAFSGLLPRQAVTRWPRGARTAPARGLPLPTPSGGKRREPAPLSRPRPPSRRGRLRRARRLAHR